MARLVMVGASHHLTPLEVRECLAFDPERWYARSPRGLPSVLVSTCNRVEVYAWVTGRLTPAVRACSASLAEAAGLAITSCSPIWPCSLVPKHCAPGAGRRGTGFACRREDQIRGQLRDALHLAESSWPYRARCGCLSACDRVGQADTWWDPSRAAPICRLGRRARRAAVYRRGTGRQARRSARSGRHGAGGRRIARAEGARVRLLNRTPGHAEALAGQLAAK